LACTSSPRPATLAIEATFRWRNTLNPTGAPLALTDAFGLDAEKRSQWRRFLARGHLADAPEDLAEIMNQLAEFLLPAAAAGIPFESRWKPAEGWRLM
jgi:hypothetical protein